MTHAWIRIAFAGALIVPVIGTAQAADIRFLCPPSLKSVMTEVLPAFEKASGNTVTLVWEVMPTMKKQIDDGAAFDVAILPPDLMDAVVKSGKISAASTTAIARTAIGVAVKKGAPRPDISTLDGTKRMLQGAKSIAYTSNGAVGNAFLAMLEKLNLTAEVTPKLKAMPGGGAVEPVAKGEVEVAVTTVPGILEISGVDFIGRLPAEVQSYVVYTAGVKTESPHAQAAAAMIRALATPAAQEVIKSMGLDIVTP